MTLRNNNHQANKAAILQNLLSLIARNPDLEMIVPSILQEAQRTTGAAAGFYLLFKEPRALFIEGIDEANVPSDALLHSILSDLQREIYVSSQLPNGLVAQYAGWAIVPIFRRDERVGVLGLLFQSDVVLDDDEVAMLMSLVDGLSIVTDSTMSAARHRKLTRNQNEFVRIVSHDLRSPLTSMQGFASMLESKMVGELNDKQAHFVEKILSGVSQMTSLVENIQDAGRYDPETGFYEMERAPCDLTDLAKRIVDNHLLPAEKQELTLTYRAGDDIPIVNVDAGMLERSVTNLVDNAIKYTPNGGRVEVAVRRDRDYILITVSDNGFGISDENLSHLFQRHFRIRRREHKRVKGSGLGLFIVRSVARQHGGEAFVESSEGEGSTFGIRIPLTGDNLLGSSRRASSGGAAMGDVSP